MNAAIKLLSSPRFAAGIVIVLILICILGTLFPGGDVIFTSILFLAPLGLFALSTATCTLMRIVPIWRDVRRPEIEVSDQFVQSLPYHAYLPGVTIPQVKRLWKGFRWREELKSKNTYLFAQKGTVGRFGPPIAHLGVLVLLLGVVVGAAYGHVSPQDTIVMAPGESQHVDGFILRLDEFNVSYYASGVAQDYRAKVTLIDSNQVQTGEITVNSPLTHKGLIISLYGYDSNGLMESGKASWVAFQIKSDAGLRLVWCGALLTIAGIVLSLYLSHRRIWIKESSEGILIGATSNKSSIRFFKIVDEFRAELENLRSKTESRD
ncbi:MAG TPA: cytochrome c biogenesis protein ResB [Candidatus Acidoferrales bacterium]|nr:cytochrome c biogenesis protein ResB [Candidatus Acidoferrales bacterium]